MTFGKRILSVTTLLTALSSIASGYYHFVYFPSRTGPFNPINLQFDLTQLTNNTVYFFISDQGPNVFVKGDSFTAVISELKLAAQSWNNVPSSQIKLAYGGLQNAATQESTPGIEVIFSDENIAPGILAQTKVTTYSNVSFLNNSTPFLPILHSQIQLRKNLTVTTPQQASFYDSSFTTMTHEFGHALGLQHTLTSASMSTYVTRSTTKAMPLGADDVAGISLLYPTPGYLATTGSITGQVTLNGSGVSLASVVAISPITGVAISNLTNPDGTYRIDAIPPGPAGNYYLVYVHPLPPAQQGEAGPDAIVLPQDPSQVAFPANTGFVTQFAPGTRDWTQASQVFVSASSTQAVNFNVQGSAGPVVSALELWGYLNNVVEASPMLPVNSSYNLVFCAPGTTSGSSQLAPGLNVSVIGAAAPAQIIPNYTKFYGNYTGCNYPFVLTGVWTSSVQATTPVALAFNVNNDVYVLPAAFFVVPSGPPTLTNLIPGVDANGNGLLTVYGSSLTAATQFVFDGTVATSTANGDGSFTLNAPPAPGPYSSSIEALNPDGQTSGQAIPFGNPPQFTYNYANPATIITPSPSQVTPGTDAMIQINGSNTNFSSQSVVGFGTSDIVVKQVFVVSATLLMVNVSVSPQAQPGAASVTVTTGLQTATLPLAMQIGAPSPSFISLRAPVTNALTGLTGVPSPGTAVINAVGIPQNLTGWMLTIGGQPAALAYTNGQLQASVPGGLGYGPQIVQLFPPSGAAVPPIAMKIDAPPPSITSVLSASGAPITATSTVHPGDVLTINMFGMFDGITPLTLTNLVASLGATTGPGAVSLQVLQFNDPVIQVQIPFSAPTGPLVPLYIGVGTRVAAPVYLNIHN
jgi:predicted Zn-dependent protease